MTEIVVFGGTSEGRRLAEAFAGCEIRLHLCVATEYGASLLPKAENIIIHTGRMDEPEMEGLLLASGAVCCLDATHPYAVDVTENIHQACEKTGVSYLRIARSEAAEEDFFASEAMVHFCENAAAAAEFLEQTQGNILLACGSRDLECYTKISNYQERCYVRVLPSTQVLEKCESLGFQGRHLIAMQGPFTEEMNTALLKQIEAKWLVTKSSGREGGYPEKCRAAAKAGARLLVLGRPAETAEIEKNGISLAEAIELVKQQLPQTALSEAVLAAPKQSSEQEVPRQEVPRQEVPRQEAPRQEVPRQEAPRQEVPRQEVYLVGMGAGDPRLLTQEAREALARAQVYIGAQRILDIWQEQTEKPRIACYKKEEIAALLQKHPEYRSIALLYSGDIGFYSGARAMKEVLPDCKLHFISGIASPVYLLNRLGIGWDEVTLASWHGKELNVLPLIKNNRYVCILVGEKTAAQRLGRQLLEHGLEQVRITLAERLSYPEERIVSGCAKDFLTVEHDPLSLLLLENDKIGKENYPAGRRLQDDEFIRGAVPMTKEEVRTLSISKLELEENSVVYDIGAGTGSVAVEAARHCPAGWVYAVEKKPEAQELILKNKEKFAVSNMELIKGEAPEILAELPAPSHVFIGGSSGRLPELVAAVREKNADARFVINAVTLETLHQTETLRERFPEYADMEITAVNIARSRAVAGYHLMTAENPVYIISFGGEK